jgi:hypothetical protein
MIGTWSVLDPRFGTPAEVFLRATHARLYWARQILIDRFGADTADT